MPPRFVDANVFLRLITRDEPAQAERCVALFERVRSGTEEITTSESVLAEVVYVLSSNLYRVTRDDIRGQLVHLLGLRGVHLPERRRYLRALDLYAEHTRLDIADALSAAHVEHAALPAILSFDRDFDRIPTIRREEP